MFGCTHWPHPHTPLNGILWFTDLYTYHQLFTHLNSVVSDIFDSVRTQLCLTNNLGVHFLFELAAVVSILANALFVIVWTYTTIFSYLKSIAL